MVKIVQIISRFGILIFLLLRASCLRQHLLGELPMSRKRERDREREKKMTFKVATYFSACSPMAI